MLYSTNVKKGVLEALTFIGKGIKYSMTDEVIQSNIPSVTVG